MNILNVNDNRLSFLPNLTSLYNLDIIHLQNNEISNIMNFSDYMPKGLVQIYLGGNKITVIGKEVFAANLNIDELDLSNNFITHIEPGAFDQNVQLRVINLHINQLNTLDNVLESILFHILNASFNNIKNFSLLTSEINFNLLNLSHNQIEHFYFNPRAKKRRMVEIVIDMSFNRLTNNISLPLPSIANTIWLNDNDIEIFDMSALENTLSDQEIYLQNNAIGTFCEHFKGNINSPKSLVRIGENPLICSCETEWLKRRTNEAFLIKDVDSLTCSGPYPKGRKPSNLINWDYFLCDSKRSCPIRRNYSPEYQCLESCHCFYSSNNSFAFVDCSQRNLTSVPNQEVHAVTMHLFLDGNNMSYLDMSSFRNVGTIEVLYLNGSHLVEFHPRTFENLTALTLLQLQNNLLKSIPEKAFSRLNNLRELHLSHNRLLQMGSFADIAMLETLELHDNHLKTYPVWELENATKLRRITVQENPWSCECEYIELFQGWLIRANNIINKEDVSCAEEQHHRRLINDKFKECADINDSQMQILVSTSSISAVIVILVILLFVYRREVKVLIYSRYGVRISRGDDDMDLDKEFDVFLSYSSKDAEFLVDNLLPNLENIEHPYRVCLHDSEFLAGGFIAENIVSAIDMCRRTIILLSEDFVQSEWCKNEFKMAHTKMLEDKRSRVVVIVKDNVPENVDPVLRAYLRTNMYLTWGERMFWKKLYFALPKPLQSNNQEAESVC